MRLVFVAFMAAGLTGCGGMSPQVAGNCGAAADQTVAQGGGLGPNCEGPPVNAHDAPDFAAHPYADKLNESGRQGGQIGHSGRAGVKVQ